MASIMGIFYILYFIFLIIVLTCFIYRYIVFLSQSNNVTLAGNIVHGQGKYKIGNLFVSPTVTNIVGQDTGIIQQ